MIKKEKILLYFILLLAICVVVIDILFFIFRPLSADKVFSNNSSTIVELKCSSENIGESFGTAEIVTSNGRLVTNAHVVTYKKLGMIAEFEKYYMRYSFEEDYREVKLLNYDTDLDLAVLEFIDLPSFEVKPIKINTKKLSQGNKVYAIGNGQNQGLAISLGIIGLPLVKIEYEGKTRNVIQCNLTINEGNSGGALLNEKGELIGITTFRTKDSKGNVIYGIAYCIPINVVLDYLNN